MSSVDVAIPCYNYGRYLEDCVETILGEGEGAQGVPVRVLIIDDCSQDNSAEIALELAKRDSRISVHRHVKNMGHIATYNEAVIDWPSADYTLLISADDLVTPGALQRATRVMDANPEAGLLFGQAMVVDNAFKPQGVLPPPSTDEYRVLEDLRMIDQCCRWGNPVSSPTAIVRTAVQKRVGGYRAHLPHTADMEIWMRFAFVSQVIVLNAVQAYYRWHAGNMSAKYFSKLLSDRAEQVQAIESVLREFQPAEEKQRIWRQQLTDRVAKEACWIASSAFDNGQVADCEAAAQFAINTQPTLRDSQQWRRLRMKRAIGPGLWNRVRPVINRLRGRTAALAAQRQAQPFAVGEKTGWWPKS